MEFLCVGSDLADKIIKSVSRPLYRYVCMTALDMSVLNEIKELAGEEDPGFLGSLIHIYLGTGPEKVKKLKDAFARADVTAVIQEAHSLKSSSANMGAIRFSTLLATLEQQAKSGKISAEMTEIFKEVEIEYLQVEKELKDLLRKASDFKV